MRMISILSLLMLAACNGGAQPGAPTAASIFSAAQNGDDIYTLRIFGDGVQFTTSLVMDQGQPDEEQVIVGATTIGASEVKEYTVTGRVVHMIGVTRMNAIAQALTVQLWKNGVEIDGDILVGAGANWAF